MVIDATYYKWLMKSRKYWYLRCIFRRKFEALLLSEANNSSGRYLRVGLILIFWDFSTSVVAPYLS